MLRLYLYILIIGHKFCNMLSILNKLPLRIANVVPNNVFLTKSKNTSTTKQKSNIKTLAGAGNWTREPCTQSGCCTTAPPIQLTISIIVQLFNCFDAMGWNVNKQSRICGPHIFNKFIFKSIGVGSGAAGAALAAPIFCLVAVLGPRFFSIRQLFVL